MTGGGRHEVAPEGITPLGGMQRDVDPLKILEPGLPEGVPIGVRCKEEVLEFEVLSVSVGDGIQNNISLLREGRA